MKACAFKFKTLFISTALLLNTNVAFSAAFTDEALWRAAVGSYLIETFDSIPGATSVPSLPTLGIRFGMLNDGTFPTVQPYSFTGGAIRSGPNNLLNDADNTLPARGPYTIFPLDPTESLYGLGLWNVGVDDTLRLSFFDGSDVLLEEVVSPTASGFFGIFNMEGAKKAVIDFVGGNEYSPIDDLQVAGTTSSVIPIPAAVWLFGSALIGLIGLRRKQSV